jgi:hypothetical protein
MRHPLFAVLLALAVVLAPGCRKKEQPAETGTLGNATDRNPATGTTGTGEPASVGTDTVNAAQQLGTAGTVAVSGTTEVHGASTQTTSTMAGPDTTTHAVATPTATSATVVTTTGTTTTAKTKKQ